ncbi:helix-turn-helix domain-containing protein [Henriciella aquimarina]|uniref:helix-turn-helix domain-containing protein n=1 Tax=Henriciella aquimarina TaxID=545261 RepID=UPI0009FD4F07|nr:helix-turn-helix domain-containing protein [Henriciella aquimarina]
MADIEHTSPGQGDDSEFFSVEEAARYLRLTRSTLDHYRCQGRGPVYRKHGARVFYTRTSLDTWSNRHTYVSTSERIKPES